MSNIALQTNQQKNLLNKKAFLESIQDKTKTKALQDKNLINLQSSIYLDATKYISIGLNSQQNENFENSKVNMEKGVTLIKEILNSNDQYIIGKNSISDEYVFFSIIYFFVN
jgi:hypothetical protein